MENKMNTKQKPTTKIKPTRKYRLKKAGVSRENHSVVLRFGLDSIRILLDAGMDSSAVALRIGCSRSTLYMALRRHWGLTPQRVAILTPVSPAITWPDITAFCGAGEGIGGWTLGQVKSLLSSNVRMGDIAKNTGVSRDALTRHASNLGYKFAEKTILVSATATTATTTSKEDK